MPVQKKQQKQNKNKNVRNLVSFNKFCRSQLIEIEKNFLFMQ
jgi:hypothetical protein